MRATFPAKPVPPEFVTVEVARRLIPRPVSWPGLCPGLSLRTGIDVANGGSSDVHGVAPGAYVQKSDAYSSHPGKRRLKLECTLGV